MFDLIEKHLILFMIFLFGIMAVSAVYFNDGHRTVTYDCRLAEISPDFPPQVRDACRKLRANK